MKRSNSKSKPIVIIQCYEDRQPISPLRKAESITSDSASNDQAQPMREANDIPPPPPPMPSVYSHQNGESKVKNIEKKMNSKVVSPDLKKNGNFHKNGTVIRTPTPDYNNKTDSMHNQNGKYEKAELESLESYKLKNPVTVPPKPPSSYFMKAPNGTATMKKITRPVSVTIGEYVYSGNGRREPTKLEFLSCDKTDHQKAVYDDEASISNRLQSELALTLSRSNLRKKTEALTDAGR